MNTTPNGKAPDREEAGRRSENPRDQERKGRKDHDDQASGQERPSQAQKREK